MPATVLRPQPALLARYAQITGLFYGMEARRESYANAATVTSLVDQAGLGNTVSGGVSPTFATGEQAGTPSVVFNSQYLVANPAVGMPASGGFSLYAVVKMTNTGSRFTLLYFGNSTNSGVQWVCDSSNKCRLTKSQIAEVGASTTSMSSSAYELWTLTYDGVTINFYRNGQLDAAVAGAQSFTYTSPVIQLGANSGLGETLQAKMPILLAYDGVHDAQLRGRVWRAMNQTYAVY